MIFCLRAFVWWWHGPYLYRKLNSLQLGVKVSLLPLHQDLQSLQCHMWYCNNYIWLACLVNLPVPWSALGVSSGISSKAWGNHVVLCDRFRARARRHPIAQLPWARWSQQPTPPPNALWDGFAILASSSSPQFVLPLLLTCLLLLQWCKSLWWHSEIFETLTVFLSSNN